MSLYDDIIDTAKEKPDQIAGWSSGIKLLQSQLQLKKAAMTQPRRDQARKQAAVLPPVIDLKSRKDDDESGSSGSSAFIFPQTSKEAVPSLVPTVAVIPATAVSSSSSSKLSSNFMAGGDPDWHWELEYDPLWPNDYEKAIKDLKDVKDKEKEKEEEERRRKYKEERDRRTRERYEEDRRKNGFGGRKESDEEDNEEDPEKEDDDDRPKRAGGGAAIAPPASLQEPPMQDSPKSASPFAPEVSGPGLSVAAKIMAKYGFKEGQGLGKQEQGIATALQVEKTSKRGGRIISEKDIMPPPPPPPVGSVPKPEPTITEMMKNPSKVVLLRNMVGPGEVDEELEPEVKDECQTKYGEVNRVVIFERPDTVAEEAVRIFVEFRRIESAIKAVVDLNGRFFGGRQVRAGFYEVERFQRLDLLD